MSKPACIVIADSVGTDGASYGISAFHGGRVIVRLSGPAGRVVFVGFQAEEAARFRDDLARAISHVSTPEPES